MDKILIVHLTNALGLHFFDWSLNFLSGNASVTPNPLEEKTAHSHKLKKVITVNDLTLHQSDNLKILILQTMINIGDWNILFPVDLSTHEGREELNEFKFDYYVKIIKSAKEQGFRIILVDWAKKHWLIPTYQTRFPMSNVTSTLQTRDQCNADWIDNYFPKAANKWNNTSKWDKREMLAVCLRPEITGETYATSLLLQFNNELDIINTDELWFNMESVLLKYININKDRRQEWLPIYYKWQQNHDISFSEDYWEILHAIYNGDSKDLSKYNLDLTKEALIQHGMIYAYDLNFKTWQLETFPNNTYELHKLLEDNIHTRDFTYDRQP
tara:strand:+ start:572 stop:1552 length:981 start_codon:yes stop_codon:yes gene_type:complete